MGKKVLVIEDDIILRKAIVTALKDAEFDISEALDGDEGLRKAISEKPDLILLDLILPKKSGWSVLDDLKKNDKVKDIPVLVLTVVPALESIEKCTKMGAVGYLIKSDYSLDDIVTSVKEHIS